MPMPKAAMHKESGPVLWENEIRLSREVLSMQAKSQTKDVCSAPNAYFGRCVLAPDPRH
jgi:hypothetical protein